MDNEYGLETVHISLINLLDALDSICKKNDIKYSLHGGTLLGAERNGKLIPWDDDIDISMTRENFSKFTSVLDSIDSDYVIDTSKFWIPRFINKKKREDYYICIDIFVWDYISEYKIGQWLKLMILKALQGMLKTEIDLKKHTLGYKFLILATWFMGLFMPRKLKLLFYKRISEYAFCGHKMFIHRSNDVYKGISYIFDSNYMNNYSYIVLEDREYMVTSRYKEFLIRNYGENYLIPPDIKERKPVHATFGGNQK